MSERPCPCGEPAWKPVHYHPATCPVQRREYEVMAARWELLADHPGAAWRVLARDAAARGKEWRV